MVQTLYGKSFAFSGGAEILPTIHALLKAEGIEVAGNPDVYEREYVSFGIDDAREIRDRANTRPLKEAQRIFTLVTPTMTTDAQNALLKTLEEPAAGAVFFIIVPSVHALLPTLRSRVNVQSKREGKGESFIDVPAFLKSSYEKRLDMLKPLYTHDETEERDLRKPVGFLQELERVLAKSVKDNEARRGIAALYRARKYIGDKGALLKPLLEQVALLTP